MNITLDNLLVPFNLLARAFLLETLSGETGASGHSSCVELPSITSKLKALGTRLGFLSPLTSKKKPGRSIEDLVI